MIPNRTFLPISGCLATSSRRSMSPWLTAAIGSPAIECDSSPTKYIGRTCPITDRRSGSGPGRRGGTTGSTAVAGSPSGVVAGSLGSGVPAPMGAPARMFDGNLIFMSTPRTRGSGPRCRTGPPARTATRSRRDQQVLAGLGRGLELRVGLDAPGKIGPLPEKFGARQVVAVLFTHVTKLVIAVCEIRPRKPPAPPRKPKFAPHALNAACIFGEMLRAPPPPKKKPRRGVVPVPVVPVPATRRRRAARRRTGAGRTRRQGHAVGLQT